MPWSFMPLTLLKKDFFDQKTVKNLVLSWVQVPHSDNVPHSDMYPIQTNVCLH